MGPEWVANPDDYYGMDNEFHVYHEPLTAVLIIIGVSFLYGPVRVKRKS